MLKSCGVLTALLCALLIHPAGALSGPGTKASPLVIGDTFTLDSKILGETRRINVYPPPGYAESHDLRVPVLYMPDGGMAEDFLHVAGLVQVSVGNGTMRPFLLVGIENTQRRRDLTGPTRNEEDKKIAPHVGGSEAFRSSGGAEGFPGGVCSIQDAQIRIRDWQRTRSWRARRTLRRYECPEQSPVI